MKQKQYATLSPIDELLSVIAQLRNPKTGCPWDMAQTFKTIAPYTIEEAYEVADAIANENIEQLEDELGDLLFQIVFYAEIAREDGNFDFHDIVRKITSKMRRRHPHVFTRDKGTSTEKTEPSWEGQKAQERKARAKLLNRPVSALDDVPNALPALMRAEKLQKRAAGQGFDWGTLAPVLAKIREELQEVEEEITSGCEEMRVYDEVGDLLFSCVNLARHLGVDAEIALRGANAKFEERYRTIETSLGADGLSVRDVDLEELDRRWKTAKDQEKSS